MKLKIGTELTMKSDGSKLKVIMVVTDGNYHELRTDKGSTQMWSRARIKKHLTGWEDAGAK